MNTHDTPRLQKLKEQQEKIRKQIRLEQNRLKDQERKDDTRRKILVGAVLIEAARKDTQLAGIIQSLLRAKLTRSDDRALFDLPPLPDNPATAQTETG